MNNEDAFPEPFGPEYVKPQNAACPDCECCTAALCAKGRASVSECSGAVDGAELVERVTNCPCSAEATRGTLSWRAGMIRAVTAATEKPLRPPVELLLKFVAESEPWGEMAELMPILAVRRYVTWRPGHDASMTDFGWAYLDARRPRQRVTVPFTVRSVDVEARTAVVHSPMLREDGLVVAPMEQVLTSRTGLTADPATWVPLRAEANLNAELDRVVLTKVVNPQMAAQGAGGAR